MESPEKKSKFQILVKYFLDNFPFEILIGEETPRGFQEERAKFYFEEISELDSALRKIEKYSVYFSEFYPDSQKISEAEAIEYHWHSYIQDFYILEERAKTIIGALKNDLPRYDIGNPEVAKRLLCHLKDQITISLKKAHDLRVRHTHKKMVRNYDLTRAIALKTIKNNTEGLKLKVSEIDKKIEQFTTKSKNDYIKMANRNELGMKEFRNFFAPRFGYLFAFLNEHDVSIFKVD